MGYNISAYIERKNNNGEWELVSTNPISSRLKYIFPEYQDFASLTWENISKGLQEKFPQETLPDGKTVCYYSFYTKTLSQLEEEGCNRIYSDDGDEIEPWGDEEKNSKLTFPINKQLVEELQYGYETMREIGRKEVFDLILNEYTYETSMGGVYRVVFVVS